LQGRGDLSQGNHPVIALQPAPAPKRGERPRRARDDATRTKGLAASRPLPAHLDRDGLRRVRVGFVAGAPRRSPSGGLTSTTTSRGGCFGYSAECEAVAENKAWSQVRVEPAGKVPRVGYLSPGFPSDPARQRRLEAVRQGLLRTDQVGHEGGVAIILALGPARLDVE